VAVAQKKLNDVFGRSKRRRLEKIIELKLAPESKEHFKKTEA
jgi:hypothetical protein